MRRVGAGIVLALVLVTACESPESDDEGSSTSADPVDSSPPTTSPAVAAVPTLLVWTSARLPPELVTQAPMLPGVTEATVVHGDLVDLVASTDADGRPVDVAPAGMMIPLDALAIDPATYAPFAAEPDRAALVALQPGQALLGETSARLRRLDVGGVLELANGARLTVVDVVADESVGAAEVVVATSGAAAAGIDTPRFLLLSHDGDRAGLEAGVVALLGDRPVRFRAAGETPYLRHADLVLPQAHVKERFGEFAYAPGTDRFVSVDPAYEAANIVTAPVPILGSVTCHREVIPALEGALRELETSGMGGLIDPAGYQGCYVASIIPGSGGVSRHSWGIAIDVNFLPNPSGLPSYADPRLEAVMERWGFIAGSHFLETDPGHFEYGSDARAS